MWNVTSGSVGHGASRMRESNVNQNRVGLARRQRRARGECLGAVRRVELDAARGAQSLAAARAAGVVSRRTRRRTRRARSVTAPRYARQASRRSSRSMSAAVRRAKRSTRALRADDARHDARADHRDLALRDRERERESGRRAAGAERHDDVLRLRQRRSASICSTSSRPAFTCPSTPSGVLPPAAIHRAPRSAFAHRPRVRADGRSKHRRGSRRTSRAMRSATRSAVGFISCRQRPTRRPRRGACRTSRPRARASTRPSPPSRRARRASTSPSRNSSARTLLPPIGSAHRSSRLIQSDGESRASGCNRRRKPPERDARDARERGKAPTSGMSASRVRRARRGADRRQTGLTVLIRRPRPRRRAFARRRRSRRAAERRTSGRGSRTAAP